MVEIHGLQSDTLGHTSPADAMEERISPVRTELGQRTGMPIASASMLDSSRSGPHRAYSRCLIPFIARRRRVHEAASRIDDHAEPLLEWTWLALRNPRRDVGAASSLWTFCTC
jgi:hypothetical protein